MKYTRVTSYHNRQLVAEHIYSTDSQADAIALFRRVYPEHKNCIVVASAYDPTGKKRRAL